jgi:hypothetical protein
MISSLRIFIITFAVLSPLIIAENSCRFEYPGKGIVDLTTLGRTDGNPKYRDVVPPDAFYSTLTLLFVLKFII